MAKKPNPAPAAEQPGTHAASSIESMLFFGLLFFVKTWILSSFANFASFSLSCCSFFSFTIRSDFFFNKIIIKK